MRLHGWVIIYMEKEKKNQLSAEGPDRKEGTREEPDFLKTCIVTMV